MPPLFLLGFAAVLQLAVHPSLRIPCRGPDRRLLGGRDVTRLPDWGQSAFETPRSRARVGKVSARCLQPCGKHRGNQYRPGAPTTKAITVLELRGRGECAALRRRRILWRCRGRRLRDPQAEVLSTLEEAVELVALEIRLQPPRCSWRCECKSSRSSSGSSAIRGPLNALALRPGVESCSCRSR